MKKLLPLWIIAITLLSGSKAFAQSLVGTWQGTLQIPNRELRTVFKISTTDADGLKAIMYSIDQGGQPIPAGATTLQGSAVKISIPGVGGTYEGKLSADGKSIAGNWSQGPMPLPLNLTRVTEQAAWTIPPPAARPKPMAADANPSFEVATIKLSKPDAQGKGIGVNGHQISTRNTSVTDLITFAYGIHARQVAGGPSWLETEKYDVLAEPDAEGAPNDRQVKMMFQKMLADRFKLTFHRDKKELTVYTIVVAKGGPKLTNSTGDPSGLPTLGLRGLGKVFTRNASMADFAALMQTTALDRPVVDQTGLTGKYDFTLDWTPDESQFGGRGGQAPPPADNSDVPPDLYTAIQQQLGLKMESTKAPVEVLIIDKVEKPSEN
jgi:uncharacterized protein (TIGR03435 family)